MNRSPLSALFAFYSWLVFSGLLACFGITASASPTDQEGAQKDSPESTLHCNASQCHQGIEDIAQAASGMTSAITSMGEEAGDPKGCVVCHGGNPAASNREAAHTGSPATIIEMNGPNRFLSDPGSPWVNEKTCGLCHKQYVSAQWNSLMMTEAGKLQGMAWAFGSQTGYEHVWANYDAENPQKPEERIGTDAYRTYMAELRQKEPNVFPDKHTKAPEAPTDLNELEKHPEKAALTYARVECQRCHLGVKGRQKRGDYRGMGCSACHIPYSNEGLYEGGDQSVPEDEPGHLLVHAIQSGGNIEVNGTKYSGIPVESCTTCHDRGKRIGVSFQGLMESAYHSPFTEGGGGQAALHTKHYLPMRPDVHLQKGMLCHDCHTTSDIHGDRFLKGTTLAAVEIECSDCHGTPWDYPWELPLGFGEEFGDDLKERQGRGVIVELPQHMRQDVVYPAKDGYLITARGNPMRRAVRNGNEVILHSAGGKELKLSPLKLKAQSGELSLEARVGMVSVKGHINKMECYTCHAGWAPQCYGCHVKIDYSKGNKSFDWVAAGQRHQDPEYAADKSEAGYNTTVPGHVEEQRSYMRWEDPPMVVNGEGRMSPAIPGCQVSATIVGPDGKTIKKNHIFRTMPDSEGSGPQGQLGLDMSPVNPHTSGKARSCASCHASPKALGYGIDRGELNRPWNESVVVDLATADGKVIPKKARSQIEPIPGLEADWSRFVTEGGKQLQTVGHHFSRSRPLNDKERNNTEREGVCLACHQDIPDDPAVNLLHHVAAHLDVLPDSDKTHADLLNKIALGSAWAQVIAPVTFAMLLLAGAWWFLRRRAGR